MASNDTAADTGSILKITDLKVNIDSVAVKKDILSGLNLRIPRGQTVALLGESGSGKSLAAKSVLRILPTDISVTAGNIMFNDQNLLTIPPKQLRQIAGNQIGMIYQEPSKALNPLMPIGQQIGETLRIHRRLGHRDTKEQVLSLMELVGIPDPTKLYRNFPHQLSGGTKQRVVIAGALACRPDLLIADEPTSALDTTVQAQILDLLERLIQDLNMSVFLISHDMGIVAALADRICVLLGGTVIEEGPVDEILAKPAHPYTLFLLNPQVSIRNNSNVKIAGTSRQHCPFLHACKYSRPECKGEKPPMTMLTDDRSTACYLHRKGGS